MFTFTDTFVLVSSNGIAYFQKSSPAANLIISLVLPTEKILFFPTAKIRTCNKKYRSKWVMGHLHKLNARVVVEPR